MNISPAPLLTELRAKAAVITGGADGIGLALARRAAAAGMKLVLADINGDALADVVAELQSQGIEAVGETVDVSKPIDITRLADAAWSAFGAVHLLANNAGIGLAKSAWETTPAEWERMLGVNLYGVIHGVREFVPRMLASREPGWILNTASAAGLLTGPALAAYNVGKFGVVAFSECLHHDLRLRGLPIGVSVLCPAWVRTKIADAGRSGAAEFAAADPVTRQTMAAIQQAVATGIAPEEVAEACFATIASGQFYILTHQRTELGVRQRLDDILSRRPPTLLPII